MASGTVSADVRELPAGTITAMFTDIVDSTELKTLVSGATVARRDKKFHSEIKEPHDRLVLALVSAHGGSKVKSTGDGFLCAFTDAGEAVICAIEIQEFLHTRPIETPRGPLRVRIGLHTGYANPSGDDYTSHVMDTASRVQGEAQPGEVLISSEAKAMAGGLNNISFEELPSSKLKGVGWKSLFRVMRPEPDVIASPALADFSNPYEFAKTASKHTFKGRDAEMEKLMGSIESGTHTAIFGLQRMGKTSLIEQGLRAALTERTELRNSILFASIDIQRLGGAQVTYRDFVHAIFESVIAQLAALGLGREVNHLRKHTKDMFTASQYERGDRTEFFARFSKFLVDLSAASGRRIVLFVDEFSEIRNLIERNKTLVRRNPQRTANLLPHDLYIDVQFVHHLSSLLKDEGVSSRVTFIILVRPFMADYDSVEGLQLLKLMKPITLRRLDEPAARELICQPLNGLVSIDPSAVDHLYALTAGHPYLLQVILKTVVDGIKLRKRRQITLKDVMEVQAEMVSDGPAYEAIFNVLISDYSVDEVMHKKEALLGKGVLALISKLGRQSDGWVPETVLLEHLAKYKIPVEKTSDILSQLTRTLILEERELDDSEFRLSVPLVRERFLRQNLYRKFFKDV